MPAKDFFYYKFRQEAFQKQQVAGMLSTDSGYCRGVVTEYARCFLNGKGALPAGRIIAKLTNSPPSEHLAERIMGYHFALQSEGTAQHSACETIKKEALYVEPATITDCVTSIRALEKNSSILGCDLLTHAMLITINKSSSPFTYQLFDPNFGVSLEHSAETLSEFLITHLNSPYGTSEVWFIDYEKLLRELGVSKQEKYTKQSKYLPYNSIHPGHRGVWQRVWKQKSEIEKKVFLAASEQTSHLQHYLAYPEICEMLIEEDVDFTTITHHRLPLWRLCLEKNIGVPLPSLQKILKKPEVIESICNVKFDSHLSWINICNQHPSVLRMLFEANPQISYNSLLFFLQDVSADLAEHPDGARKETNLLKWCYYIHQILSYRNDINTALLLNDMEQAQGMSADVIHFIKAIHKNGLSNTRTLSYGGKEWPLSPPIAMMPKDNLRGWKNWWQQCSLAEKACLVSSRDKTMNPLFTLYEPEMVEIISRDISVNWQIRSDDGVTPEFWHIRKKTGSGVIEAISKQRAKQEAKIEVGQRQNTIRGAFYLFLPILREMIEGCLHSASLTSSSNEAQDYAEEVSNLSFSPDRSVSLLISAANCFFLMMGIHYICEALFCSSLDIQSGVPQAAAAPNSAIPLTCTKLTKDGVLASRGAAL